MTILVNTAAALEITIDSDGDPTDADAAPTVTVTRADGTVLVAAATATKPAGVGIYRHRLTAAQTAQPDVLTSVWSFAIRAEAMTIGTVQEIVGAHLFTDPEARAHSVGADTTAPLSDATKYPDAVLHDARDRITDRFAAICGVSFIPRFALEIQDGRAGVDLLVDRTRATALISIATRVLGATAWTAFTAAELADTQLETHGELIRETLGVFPTGRRNVRVQYVHGWERVPTPIRDAALDVLVHTETRRGSDPRILSATNELGTIRYAVPGGSIAPHYGLPDADAVLKDYSEKVPAVA